MNPVVITQLTNTFVAFAEHQLGIVTSTERIETVVRDVLFTSRQLWDCLNIGLVTAREVAEGLAAHLHTSLGEENSNEKPWIQFIDEAEQIILRLQGEEADPSVRAKN